MRGFLTLLIGAVLLGGCTAKQTAGSAQAFSAQEDKDRAGLAASEDYERAVASYSDCILEHTANLSACEKQRAIMNGLGGVFPRSSLSQSYKPTPGVTQTTNSAGVSQGADTANTPQATSSLPARIPPPPQQSITEAHPEPADARSTPTPIPF